jgi:putative flippase GtrA
MVCNNSILGGGTISKLECLINTLKDMWKYIRLTFISWTLGSLILVWLTDYAHLWVFWSNIIATAISFTVNYFILKKWWRT